MTQTMLLPVVLTESEKVHVLGELSHALTALECARAAKKAAGFKVNPMQVAAMLVEEEALRLDDELGTPETLP